MSLLSLEILSCVVMIWTNTLHLNTPNAK